MTENNTVPKERCKGNTKTFLIKNGYEILECENGYRFVNIKSHHEHTKTVYSDSYFFEGKMGGYPNYLDQRGILEGYGIRYATLLSKYIKPGKILDIGCAAGFILKGYEQKGWQCYGVEPNETMAQFGRKNLKLEIITGNFENFSTQNKFDVISLIQVIGHLHDLKKSLLSCCQILNNGGLILVESWDRSSLFARIMGKFWHEYNPPSVINWFNDKTITHLFEEYGFSLVNKGRPRKKINMLHGLSLIDENTPNFRLKKRIFGILKRWFGKITLPYPFFDLKWYIFKKDDAM